MDLGGEGGLAAEAFGEARVALGEFGRQDL